MLQSVNKDLFKLLAGLGNAFGRALEDHAVCPSRGFLAASSTHKVHASCGRGAPYIFRNSMTTQTLHLPSNDPQYPLFGTIYPYLEGTWRVLVDA